MSLWTRFSSAGSSSSGGPRVVTVTIRASDATLTPLPAFTPRIGERLVAYGSSSRSITAFDAANGDATANFFSLSDLASYDSLHVLKQTMSGSPSTNPNWTQVSAGNATDVVFTTTDPVVCLVDDGALGDPVCTVGEYEFVFLLV